MPQSKGSSKSTGALLNKGAPSVRSQVAYPCCAPIAEAIILSNLKRETRPFK